MIVKVVIVGLNMERLFKKLLIKLYLLRGYDVMGTFNIYKNGAYKKKITIWGY